MRPVLHLFDFETIRQTVAICKGLRSRFLEHSRPNAAPLLVGRRPKEFPDVFVGKKQGRRHGS
jgi:hypothetical protein